ncbi:MAG: alpha/beta hydrolase [Clostridia bacterium]|nr:alpha/beta hydrolase [Clostridia bacterium]
MKYFEFGQRNEKLMVLLHGGGICYRGALPVAEALSKDFHVILVAYDGFNPTEPETEFVSVMDEAKRVGDYVVEHYGGKIDILYALSYGCRVLLEVLADRRLTITTAIADGMSTREYPRIRSKLGKDIYCFFFTGFFYIMMGKAGPVRKKLIARLVGRKPEEAERLLYPEATWNSWKNQDYCLINHPINFEVFRNADMHIWHGAKSDVEKKLARDIRKWQDAGYAFTYRVFPNVGHGALVGEYTEQFVEEIKATHASSLQKQAKTANTSEEAS